VSWALGQDSGLLCDSDKTCPNSSHNSPHVQLCRNIGSTPYSLFLPVPFSILVLTCSVYYLYRFSSPLLATTTVTAPAASLQPGHTTEHFSAHSFSIYVVAVIKTRINGIANPHKRKREYVATENKNALRWKKKSVATEFQFRRHRHQSTFCVTPMASCIPHVK
jgi:hypothetical protein